MKIDLVPVTAAIRAACARNPKDLEPLLGLDVPDGWPEFPEAFTASLPAGGEWPGFLFVDSALRSVVGNGGFAGPPDAAGQVEIGYEVAPAFRNRGYATETVRQLLARAFRNVEVGTVVAHTLPERNASNAVLARSGFIFWGVVDRGEDGAVWRWAHDRRSGWRAT